MSRVALNSDVALPHSAVSACPLHLPFKWKARTSASWRCRVRRTSPRSGARSVETSFARVVVVDLREKLEEALRGLRRRREQRRSVMKGRGNNESVFVGGHLRRPFPEFCRSRCARTLRSACAVSSVAIGSPAVKTQMPCFFCKR